MISLGGVVGIASGLGLSGTAICSRVGCLSRCFETGVTLVPSGGGVIVATDKGLLCGETGRVFGVVSSASVSLVRFGTVVSNGVGLKIGPALSSCILPGFLSCFLGGCPGVAMSVSASSGSDVYGGLGSDGLSVNLVSSFGDSSGLVRGEFLGSEVILVVPCTGAVGSVSSCVGSFGSGE